MSLLSTSALGGCLAFSSTATCLEDLPRVRPTHLGAPPVFWTLLYQRYLQWAAEGLPDAAARVGEIIGGRLQVARSV